MVATDCRVARAPGVSVVCMKLAGDLGAKSFCRPSFCLCGLFLPILRRGAGFERTKKPHRDTGNFIDCRQKRIFISFRRFIETGYLSHKLERSISNFFVSDERVKVEKRFNISAHSACTSKNKKFCRGGSDAVAFKQPPCPNC